MPSTILSKPKGGTPGSTASRLKKLLRAIGLPFEDGDSKASLKKLLGSGEAKRSINKLEEARRKRKKFLDNQ